MADIPRRHSLATQTVAYLKQSIAAGSWGQWLPSERTLCETLQISRNTLRAALVQLKQEGIIRPVHGSGNEIVVKPKRVVDQSRSRDVAVLSPEPLERLRPAQTLWIDELRAMLNERGYRLHVFHGRRYFRTNPGPALKKLVTDNDHGCWILTLAPENVQRWFERRKLPCLVAGSTYPGVMLPYRDLDHRAMCRHAAGVMLGLGHRRVALLMRRSPRAGDVESERGFVEAIRQSPHRDADVVVSYHDATVPSICNVVRQLMERKTPPTALLVPNAYHYLTVVTRLAQLGYQVPHDVSVVSRDEDSFLAFVVPSPGRYIVNPHVMGKALLLPVLELLEDGAVTAQAVRMVPEFIRGESLKAPVARS